MADTQSPTPSANNPEGSDMRSIAGQIEGLLDEDGQYNPGGKASRALDPDSYEQPDRDEQGRFTAKPTDDEPSQEDVDPGLEAEGAELDEDTKGDTDEILADSAVDETQDSDSEETAPIRTVAELSEALGLSREEFLESITDTFGAAGEEVTVTLADQLKGFQKDADYRRSTTELANAKREFEFGQHQRMQEFETGHQLLAAHINATEQLIAQKLESPQMAELRRNAPEEWTALQMEISQDLAQVRQRRQEAAQQYAEFKQAQAIETKSRQLQQLQAARPDFNQQHNQLVRSTFESLGYMSDEINQVVDHRAVLGVLELAEARAELAELRELKAKAEKTVQRVKQDVPQLQRPGKQRSTRSNAALQRDNVAKLKSRAAKSGTVGDAAAVIETMI